MLPITVSTFALTIRLSGGTVDAFNLLNVGRNGIVNIHSYIPMAAEMAARSAARSAHVVVVRPVSIGTGANACNHSNLRSQHQ